MPPGARVLDLAAGDGRHLGPLAALGFDVWGVTAGDPDTVRRQLAETVGEVEADRRVVQAAPDATGHPDAWADWAVLAGVPDAGLAVTLAEARRVLRPGGWVWVEADGSPASAAASAGLAVAEAPAPDGDRVHAVYRRPGGVG